MDNPVRHEADNHAPFAHFVITTPSRVVTRKQGNSRVKTTIGGTEFIVCAFCRHWIGRRADRCTCEASCHADSRAEIPQVTAG